MSPARISRTAYVVAARTLPPEIVAILRETVAAAAKNPDPVSTARSITRATTIVGLMLEDMSAKRSGPGAKASAWIARIGQVAWGLVELAAPRSLGEVLFQYWIWLLYALGVAIIAIGAVTGAPGVTRAGVLAGVFAAAAHMLVLGLRAWFRRGSWIGGVALPLLLVSSAVGGYLVYRMWGLGVTDAIPQLGSATEAVRVLGPPAAGKWALARQSIALDWGFIPVYVLWYFAAAALAAARCRRFARPYRGAALVALLASLAAIADIMENLRAWLVLHGADFRLPYATGAKFGFIGAASAALIALIVIAVLDSRQRPLGSFRAAGGIGKASAPPAPPMATSAGKP